MTRTEEIQTTLGRMAALLRLGGDDDWARALEAFHGDVAIDSARAMASIRAMYGGMGSLNDVVLHRGGVPLQQENDEFDQLRHRLYELCQ